MDKALEVISGYILKRQEVEEDGRVVLASLFIQTWGYTQWHAGIELQFPEGKTVRQYEDFGDTAEEAVKGVAYRLNGYQ